MKRGAVTLVLAAGLCVTARASAEPRTGLSAGTSHASSDADFSEGGALGRRHGFALRAGLGGSYTRLYSLNIGAIETELGAGAHALGGSIFGVLGYGRGATGAGLDASTLVSSAEWELPLDRLRLGFGPRFAFVSVDRATGGEEQALTLGGTGYATFDLAAAKPFVLFARLRLVADFTVVEEQDADPTALLLGTGLAIGVRY